MLCVCVSIGAWAGDATLIDTGDKNFVITTNGDGDLSRISDWLTLKGDGNSAAQSITVIGDLTSTGLATITSKLNPYGNGNYNLKLDLSQANMNSLDFSNSNLFYKQICKLILPQGISLPEDYSTGSAVNAWGALKTIYAFDGTTVTVAILNEYTNEAYVHASDILTDTQYYNSPQKYAVVGNNSDIVATVIDELKAAGKTVEEAAAPPYVLSSSTWELIDNNTANNSIGDQIYWKVNGTETSNVTINVAEAGGLKAILDQLETDGYTSKFTKMVITGELNETDMLNLSMVNADALDMSGVTLVENRIDGKSILSQAGNTVVRLLVLPEGLKRDDVKDDGGNVTQMGVVNAATLSGFGNLYSAVSLERRPGATSTDHETYTLTSYVKKPGSLQSAVMLIDGWGYNGTKNIGTGSSSVSGVMLTGNDQTQYLKDIVVSGTINAYDITGEAVLKNGHIEYEPQNSPSEPVHGAVKHGVVTGYTVYGPFNGAVLTSIDLRDAEFYDFPTYKADFTIAKLGIMNQVSTHKLVIPETPSVNEIPGDFLYVASGSMNGLKEICIPSNIEYIRAYAFTGSLDHIWTTAGSASYENADTKYDNGAVTKVQKKDDYGNLVYDDKGQPVMEDMIHYGYNENYAEYQYGTYTFSSNLKLIETSAFANSTAHVKDVYVLALEAPQCHVDAFTTAMYYGNNGYDQTVIDDQGIVTRDAYCKSNYQWITMLHYPKEVQAPNLQRYTDPTRDYSIATGEKDGNGATIYFPNHSEFGYAYGQGTTGYVWDGWKPKRTGYANAIDYDGTIGANGWQVADQSSANALYNSNPNAEKTLKTFYDVTDGGNSAVTPVSPAPVTIHDIYWSERDYQLADHQVDESYVRLYDSDYRGWHQFVLNGYSANTTRIVEFERSYITDSDWWTVCLPYDLTRAEMIRFFGDKDSGKIPYLSRLLYVTRDVENTHITLNFSKNLMEHKEIMAKEGDVHGQLNNGINDDHSYGIVTVSETEAPGDNDVVLHAGVPYVIKPYIPTKTEANKNQENVSRKFAFYKDNPEDEALYEKLKAAREMNGRAMIDLVEAGLYTVPALIINNTTDNMHEAEKTDKVIKINNVEYPVSDKFTYTMVGSFFKNVLPQHSYYLGWKWTNKANNEGKACFFYKDTETIKWAWTNNTAIICPNWVAGTAVHEAGSTADPARWIVPDDTYTLESDDFVAAATGAKRVLDITIESDSADEFGMATGIVEVNANTKESQPIRVYGLNGSYVGSTLNGLSKGVYMVNGKKYIVK